MENNIKTPKWFWGLVIFFLLWNIMGVASFFQHTFISQEALDALPKAERELYGSYPLWTVIAFAIATFFGLAGSIGLLLKKKWAKQAFIVSLVGIIPQIIHNIFFTNAREVYGSASDVMPILVVLLGLFLIWFSIYGIKRGWLK